MLFEEWVARQRMVVFGRFVVVLFQNCCSFNSLIIFFPKVSPGDTGWDVFSLDYHVDGPISTVSGINF